MDLADDLRTRLTGRVAVVGIGNPDLGDDGAGCRLAEALAARGVPEVLVAERTPERLLGPLRRGGYDRILFLDAVEIGAPPGAAGLLEGTGLAARHPQLSTHKLSLGTLARLLEAEAGPRVLLLGIQPGSLRPGAGLSEAVAVTVGLLADLLADLLPSGCAAAAPGGRP